MLNFIVKYSVSLLNAVLILRSIFIKKLANPHKWKPIKGKIHRNIYTFFLKLYINIMCHVEKNYNNFVM